MFCQKYYVVMCVTISAENYIPDNIPTKTDYIQSLNRKHMIASFQTLV